MQLFDKCSSCSSVLIGYLLGTSFYADDEELRYFNFYVDEQCNVLKQTEEELMFAYVGSEFRRDVWIRMVRYFRYSNWYFLSAGSTQEDFQVLYEKKSLFKSRFGTTRYADICDWVLYTDAEHGVLASWEL